MSVLIKGMEMPKDGTYNIVYIYSDGRVSMPFWGKGMQIVQDINAIPIPPHGRLIDADIMIKKYEPDMNRRIYGGNFIFDLEHAPTVIPADKDGET